jgi:hypothetical protein
MRPTSLVLLAVAAAVALCGAPASAALYKWVDANGRTVYSDQPPASPNVQHEKLNPVAPASNPNAAKELAQQDADLKKRQADRAQAAQKADKDRAAREKRTQECEQIANNIRQLGWGQVVLMRANEKGEQVPMDSEAREKEKARLEGVYKEHCG